MKSSLNSKVSVLTLAVISALQPVLAEPGKRKAYGVGNSFAVGQLPPGHMRSKLESLPTPVREKAMGWLHSFTFTDEDLNFLDIDAEGAVLYKDTFLPDAGDISDAISSELQAEPVAAADTFFLHSKPNATKVVYVDFDGHVISGTAWNNNTAGSLLAKSFDLDGSSDNFNTDERARIAEIWHRIAEDYAPFDIDVTTEEPLIFNSTTGHLLITHSVDQNGINMPASSGGGVAYVGVWGLSDYPTYSYYSPALVYYNNLGSGFAPYVAEAASHELGHNLNLSHDGYNDGITSLSYYEGHGSGFVSWASIMGVGYYSNVTQWSKGEYNFATQFQDDLSLISDQLGYRADDHGNNALSATPLQINASGEVLVSNPETDPSNLYAANKGIIETRADVDWFDFDTSGGNLTLEVTPAWDAFYRDTRRGSNLDVQITLYDSTGTVVTTANPTDETDALIVANVTSGHYSLAVTGTGHATVPYSDYGSLGQYYIAGLIPQNAPDNTAPTPSPMTWSINPVAESATTISMTATTAVDDSGVVEYRFECTQGGAGCTDSAWQSSPYYVANGLVSATSYSYQVRARDASGNETIASAVVTATTLGNNSPLAETDVINTNEDQPVTVDVLMNDSDLDGDVLSVLSVTQATHGFVSTDGTQVTYTPDTNYAGSDSFIYTVTDGVGGQAQATVAISINAVNDAPIANRDTATVVTGGSVDINVLANDTDIEPGVLTVIAVSGGSRGSAQINAEGGITYTAGSRRGTDSISYTIIDSDGAEASGTVNVSITRNRRRRRR